FRMHQVDAAVLQRLARGLAPIQIFVPFDARTADVVEAAQLRDRAAERTRRVHAEKSRELLVDHSAMAQRRQNHTHRWFPPEWPAIIRSRERDSQRRPRIRRKSPVFSYLRG